MPPDAAEGVSGCLPVACQGGHILRVIPEDVREGKVRRLLGLGDKLEALQPVPGDPRFDSVGAFGRLDLPGWWRR